MQGVLFIQIALGLFLEGQAPPTRLAVEWETVVHALAMNVATVRVQGECQAVRLSVAISARPNVDDILEADVVFNSLETLDNGVVIVAPMAVVKRERNYHFTFEKDGVHKLTWRVECRGGPTLEVSHDVLVSPARRVDVAFLESAVGLLLSRDVLGKDSRSLAAGVIGKLLEATQQVEGFEGQFNSIEKFESWVGGIARLGSEYPESSYTDLALYYAGAGRINQLAESAGELAEQMDDSQRAQLLGAKVHLRTVSERGDRYFAPRARIQLIRAEVLWGEQETTEAMLLDFRRNAARDGTTAELLRSVEDERQRLQRRRQGRQP